MDKESRACAVEALALLQAARCLLDEPTSWVKAAYARNAYGAVLGAESNFASSWCTLGALKAFNPDSNVYSTAQLYIQSVVRTPVSWFNDALCTKHSDVLHAYDAAIEKVASEIDKA